MSPSDTIELPRELVERAFRLIQSAYATPEWLEHARTERTDHVRDELEKLLGGQCKSCGSFALQPYEGEFETGVIAPDGGKEYQFSHATLCLECGAVESD